MSTPSGTNPYEQAPPEQAGYASPYGSPMPPAQYAAAPTPAGPPPKAVVNAFRIMIARAILGVLGLFIVVATKSSLRDAVAKKFPDYSTAKVNSTVNGLVAAAIVIGLVFALLYVLLALQVRKGKNWARIITWILAGLGLLSVLTALATPAAGASRGLSLLDGLIDLAIIVLLLQKDSNAYFRRPKF